MQRRAAKDLREHGLFHLTKQGLEGGYMLLLKNTSRRKR